MTPADAVGPFGAVQAQDYPALDRVTPELSLTRLGAYLGESG